MATQLRSCKVAETHESGKFDVRAFDRVVLMLTLMFVETPKSSLTVETIEIMLKADEHCGSYEIEN
jgi:hypothetical protein